MNNVYNSQYANEYTSNLSSLNTHSTSTQDQSKTFNSFLSLFFGQQMGKTQFTFKTKLLVPTANSNSKFARFTISSFLLSQISKLSKSRNKL